MKILNSLTYGLIILRAEDLVKAFGCRFPKPRGNVATSIQSYCYVRVG
jgi:hypothetical protein